MAGVNFENEDERRKYYRNANRHIKSISLMSGNPVHYTGHVNKKGKTIEFDDTIQEIYIRNAGNFSNIDFSFDQGEHFFTLPSKEIWHGHVSIKRIFLKSSGFFKPKYQIIVIK